MLALEARSRQSLRLSSGLTWSGLIHSRSERRGRPPSASIFRKRCLSRVVSTNPRDNSSHPEIYNHLASSALEIAGRNERIHAGLGESSGYAFTDFTDLA